MGEVLATIERLRESHDGWRSKEIMDTIRDAYLDEQGGLDWRTWFRDQCAKLGTPKDEQSPEIVDIALAVEGWIDDLLAEREATRWRPASEPPTDGRTVLVYIPKEPEIERLVGPDVRRKGASG